MKHSSLVELLINHIPTKVITYVMRSQVKIVSILRRPTNNTKVFHFFNFQHITAEHFILYSSVKLKTAVK